MSRLEEFKQNIQDIVQRIGQEIGEDKVSLDTVDRKKHSVDYWARNKIQKFANNATPKPPAAVVSPESTEDVSKIFKLCFEAGIPVTPYGGGSGVCGAIETNEDSIVLSTRSMQGLTEDVDTNSLKATFLAGTNSAEAERMMNEHGLTIGSHPQSIDLSTIGGNIATKAIGQYSTLYGGMEDMFLYGKGVLADGTIVDINPSQSPRNTTGMDLRHLFLGTEGQYGMITEVGLKLHKQPTHEKPQVFAFDSFEDGLKAIQEITQSGLKPSVVRMYDGTEAAYKFVQKGGIKNAGDIARSLFGKFNPAARGGSVLGATLEVAGKKLLFIQNEGQHDWQVECQAYAIKDICAKYSGKEEPTTELFDYWFKNKNHVPSFESLLEWPKNMIADTIEVSASWDKIQNVYDEVTKALYKETNGIRFFMAHSSHSYQTGTNLYFIFAAREGKKDMTETYDKIWKTAQEATLKAGGSIAHHHGVGRVRAPFLEAELGKPGLETLHKIKEALDPKNILNPGVLPKPSA